MKIVDLKFPRWKLTQKKRFYSGEYKIAQFDIRNDALHTEETEASLIQVACNLGLQSDLVLISDYRHGMISQNIISSVLETVASFGIPVWADSQISQEDSNHLWYRGVDRMFLNGRERESILNEMIDGKRLSDPPEFYRNSLLLELYRNVVLKLGSEGAASIEEGGAYYSETAYPTKVVDTCGAGDAFFAAYAISHNIRFANYWAAMSTTYKGTVVPEEKHRRFENGIPVIP